MSEESGEFIVARIVVEIDASSREFARLESALDLAVRLKARLFARFVEDVDLLRLAGLPASRQVSWGDASLQPLEPAHTRRALRIQAQRVQRRLMLAASKVRVECTFETVQGKTLRLDWDWLESDLYVVGGRGYGRGSSARNDSAVASISTFYDGGEPSRLALAAAAQIAASLGRRLRISVPDATPEQAQALGSEVQSRLAPRQFAAIQVRRVEGRAPETVLESVLAGPSIPVLSRRQSFVSPSFLNRVLESAEMAFVVP